MTPNSTHTKIWKYQYIIPNSNNTKIWKYHKIPNSTNAKKNWKYQIIPNSTETKIWKYHKMPNCTNANIWKYHEIPLSTDAKSYFNTYLIEWLCTYIGTQKTWLALSVCPISDQAVVWLFDHRSIYIAFLYLFSAVSPYPKMCSCTPHMCKQIT